jgi:D-alanyl-D-alanine carboxypeptidase (penicillin-binding protein 5/6)
VIARPGRLPAALAAVAVAVAVAVLAAAVVQPAPAHAAAAAPPKPRLSADTAIVIDARTGERLYGRAPDRRHAIASTTKIMTALVARQRASLDDVFPASSYRPAPIESQIHLKRGERLTLHDLLEAMLLPSANDAAMAIAEGVAGSKSAFVDEMNAKAAELGLDGTSFANPVGLDDPNNFSTAADLAQMARVLLRDKMVAKIVDSPRARLETGARPRTVVNRNRLVAQYPWVTGVKTGRTTRAGYVLVGSATRGGAAVISVVTGEPSEAARDADSLTLLRYGLGQFRRATVVRERRPIAQAKVKYHGDEHVDLVPTRAVALTIRRGERVGKVVTAPGVLEGPLPAGRRVGTVAVSYRGHVVRRVPVVTASAVRGANVLDKVASAVGGGGAALAFVGLAMLSGLAALRVRAVRRRGRQKVRGGRRRR